MEGSRGAGEGLGLVAGWLRRDVLGLLTRTVLRMVMRRGKSDTPFPSVSTDDSRKLRDVWSEVTQSL